MTGPGTLYPPAPLSPALAGGSWGMYTPQYFSWKWKIPHTMYSKSTQPRRMIANYAVSVAQISSVCSIFRKYGDYYQ